jgi:hypothetical protein
MGQFQPAQSAGTKSVWYRYEGSHWNPPPDGPKKTGIDWAKDQETREEYLMHMLVGHHGWFSLTPMWLFALIGMIVGTCKVVTVLRQALFREPGEFPWFVQPLGLAVSIVVIAFYVLNDDSRNYGGFANGLRWLMWLTPIWLTCMMPAVDWLAARCWGRWLGGLCLVMSVFSMCYQLWNPWRQPWIYDLMIEMGCKGY